MLVWLFCVAGLSSVACSTLPTRATSHGNNSTHLYTTGSSTNWSTTKSHNESTLWNTEEGADETSLDSDDRCDGCNCAYSQYCCSFYEKCCGGPNCPCAITDRSSKALKIFQKCVEEVRNANIS